MCEENQVLVSKCLDFCQMLANKSNGFNFSLTMGSVSFSLDTRVVDTKMTDPVSLARKNKSSPSTRRRSAKRSTLFLESKKQNKIKEPEKQTDATGSLKVCDLKTMEHLDCNNERYHTCDICGKEYGSKLFLDLHNEKDHVNKKNFVFNELMLDEWDPEAAGGNH